MKLLEYFANEFKAELERRNNHDGDPFLFMEAYTRVMNGEVDKIDIPALVKSILDNQ